MNRRILLLASLGCTLVPQRAHTPEPNSPAPYLVELPVSRPLNDTFVIILSGDGGWQDLDRTIGNILQARGIPVLGWDCLEYFWRHRSVEDVAQDVTAAIEAYAARWRTPRVALVGYSFGADVLPSAYNRLPPSTRARVRLISCLAMSRDADYEITASGFVGLGGSDEIAIEPELSSVNQDIFQCFYGRDEADETGCTLLDAKRAQIIETAGGHHFDENYEALAERIMERIR
ncbi:virulence factor family protein [Roseomonas elaeocarpi]|uniref:Virulence factor family protein n=1 Tax=Roseomonas elaeocarpi TaxID=907779 RepID=A0ABV6JQM6_9PROT